MAKSSKAKPVCFETFPNRLIAEITRNRNGHTRSVNCTHFGILSVIDRPYFKLFLITYKVNSSSRHLTLRNTTRDAFMDKYIRVRESIFLNLFRRLCSNSLITSATTTSRNISPTPWGCKIVWKRVLFFPPPCKQALKATCRVLVEVLCVTISVFPDRGWRETLPPFFERKYQ